MKNKCRAFGTPEHLHMRVKLFVEEFNVTQLKTMAEPGKKQIHPQDEK